MNSDGQGMLVLDEAACRALLRSTRLGRIALTDHALPMILPVAFTCLDLDIIFRVGSGALARAADAEQVVCFETDWADSRIAAAWSVAAIGHLSRVDDPDLIERCRLADLPLGAGSAIARRPARREQIQGVISPCRRRSSRDVVGELRECRAAYTAASVRRLMPILASRLLT